MVALLYPDKRRMVASRSEFTKPWPATLQVGARAPCSRATLRQSRSGLGVSACMSAGAVDRYCAADKCASSCGGRPVAEWHASYFGLTSLLHPEPTRAATPTLPPLP